MRSIRSGCLTYVIHISTARLLIGATSFLRRFRCPDWRPACPRNLARQYGNALSPERPIRCVRLGLRQTSTERVMKMAQKGGGGNPGAVTKKGGDGATGSTGTGRGGGKKGNSGKKG